jgi:hypothetical protein
MMRLLIDVPIVVRRISRLKHLESENKFELLVFLAMLAVLVVHRALFLSSRLFSLAIFRIARL